ncbi:hypothetical protein BH18ACT10_BH18ACT10_11790 [soil metagenome]
MRRTWTGQAVFPTRRNRFTGMPDMAKAFADLTLDDREGMLALSVLWVFNEPVPEMEFRWDEVESMTRMRWSWPLRGVKIRLRREVVEGNRRRSFYFFAWGRAFLGCSTLPWRTVSGSPPRPGASLSCGQTNDLAGVRTGLNSWKLCDNSRARDAGKGPEWSGVGQVLQEGFLRHDIYQSVQKRYRHPR